MDLMDDVDGIDSDWQVKVKYPKAMFELTRHLKARRAYAWGHFDRAKDERTRFVAVLEIPPVDSAQKAVQVQIVKDVKEAKK